jgi:sec-independent protein translocase protein TatC
LRILPKRLGHGEQAALVDHLGELRARIVVSLVAVVAAFIVAYVFHGQLITWLEQALPPDRRKLTTLSVGEPFITSVMVSFYAGFLVAVPIVLWQAWAFFAPAFSQQAVRTVRWLVVFATVLAALGIVFGYFVALPASVKFLTNYDAHLYDIQIRARDYLSYASTVLLAVTVVFEVPVFILGCVRLRVLTYERLKKNRRIGYVIMTVIAVALPGVDPVTTTIEMIPLFILFEGSIWMAYFMEKRWAKRAAAEDAAFDAGLEDSLEV